MHSQFRCGSNDAGVLVQEYLCGKEYVIDHVSRDGIHKTNMVWTYDKRPANDSAHCYFGMKTVPSESPVAKQLIAYTRAVLDALGIRNGATHTEVIFTSTGPALVEVNCRAHGGGGTWTVISEAMTGYSQVKACIDCYTDQCAFERLPDTPPPSDCSACYGEEVMLVSHAKGRVASTPGYDVIQQLDSVVHMTKPIQPNQELSLTVDLFTSAGSCILVHSNPDVVHRDVALIRRLEQQGKLFQLHGETMANTPPPFLTQTSSSRVLVAC